MHVSQKSYHNHISETKVLGFSPSFGKDPDDEVSPEPLSAVELSHSCHMITGNISNILRLKK